MKLISALVFLVLVVSLAPGQVPTAQIKIKEKSGFLGMGDPLFMEVRLSNRSMETPLTDLNVNAGQFYYFVCLPVGDWTLDSDFLTDDLPNLSLMQGGRKYPVEWNKEFTQGDSALLVGFGKEIHLNDSIKVIFQDGERINEGELRVPQQFWPGYSGLRNLEARTDSAFNSRELKQAAMLCEQILGQPSYAIFPSYAGYLDKRTSAFSTFFNNTWNAAWSTVNDAQMKLKLKIATLDSITPEFQYVQDSLPRPALSITTETPGVGPILERATNAISWTALKRDSLHQVMDDQNVRWILNGSVTGRTGFAYKTMLEALAYAYSSLDFTDTAAAALICSLPEDQRANLTKDNLLDSYDTFLRLTNERYQQGLPIFDAQFLLNVQHDTASFRLPFYSMLKAINDYYDRRFEEAVGEIFRILRVSYDADISARYDQMRVMIQVRQGKFRPEAMRLLQEAASLESSDPDAAGERYRQAATIAPDFAYASFSLGKYYSRLNDPIRAQTFFERAYQKDTLYLSAYREAYNLFRRVGNYKPMIQVLTTALQRGNDYWETHSNLGLAYMGDGDPARAIQQYELALSINPRSYTTNIQLGLAYQTVKEYQKAREYFNNAINIDPLRQEAVEYLSRLNELQRSGK